MSIEHEMVEEQGTEFFNYNKLLIVLAFVVLQEDLWRPVEANELEFCLNDFEASTPAGCCYNDASYTNELSYSSLADPMASITFSPPRTTLTASITSSFPLPPPIPVQNDQADLADIINGSLSDLSDSAMQVGPCSTPRRQSVFELGRFSQQPVSPVRMDSGGPPKSCSFSINASALSDWNCVQDPAISPRGIMLNSGQLCPPNSVYGSSELQALVKRQQKMVKAGCGQTAANGPEITSPLDESKIKVGRLSMQERKEKIHRYIKKRNERNFSKKIEYVCRKTLADRRPRVRGRFAKNDELGEVMGPWCSNHECEGEARGEEQKDIPDSPEIFAHISGMNSFAWKYPIASWM